MRTKLTKEEEKNDLERNLKLCKLEKVQLEEQILHFKQKIKELIETNIENPTGKEKINEIKNLKLELNKNNNFDLKLENMTKNFEFD